VVGSRGLLYLTADSETTYSVERRTLSMIYMVDSVLPLLEE